ncbi:MAG: hypothetical protein NUW22_04890 [Acidobacteria bacterium]|nr:hypothetical protein [Acidobacteriota bacterium]
MSPRDYSRLFGRAFLLVALVAWNVRNVAQGEFGLAFLTGTLVSWVWWANSRSAAHSDARYARHVYALGAGLGTVFGVWIGGHW